MSFNPETFATPIWGSSLVPYPRLPLVTPEMYGAKGDGVTDDSVAIQSAIDACNNARGGVVLCSPLNYNLGTTTLTIYQNIVITSPVEAGVQSSNRGCIFLYSGTGTVIYGQNLLDIEISNIKIDASTSSGTAVIGLYLNGCWRGRIKNNTIRGVTPSKGYSILLDTNGEVWGSQHNYFEGNDTSDGVFRIAGTTGSQSVTTTVVSVNRGLQYDVFNSQITFIDSTAEGWTTGGGFTFSTSNGTTVCGLLGCDIEGSGSPGIIAGSGTTISELGTVWSGFSGAERVSGDMSDIFSYGGIFTYSRNTSSTINNTYYPILRGGTQQLGNYVDLGFIATDQIGGEQEGHIKFRRYLTGSLVTSHDFQRNFLINKTVNITNSAATVLTLNIKNGYGVSIRAHASGTQSGDQSFSDIIDISCRNNSNDTSNPVVGNRIIAPSGYGSLWTVSGSGPILTIQYTGTTLTPSPIDFEFEILGSILSYS